MSFLTLLLGAGAGAAATLAILRGRGRWGVPVRPGPGRADAPDPDAVDADTPPAAGPSAAASLAAAREEVKRGLEAVRVRLGARRALLWDVDATHGVARCGAFTSGDRPPEIWLEGDALGWALEHALPMRLTTPQRWSRGGRGCAIPLRRDGRGALVTFEFDVEMDLPDPDSLATWGGYLGAFARAEVYQAEAMHAVETKDALLNVLHRLPNSLRLEDFADEITEAARELGQVDGAAFALWKGEEGEVLEVKSDAGAPPRGIRFRMGESMLGLVAQKNTAVVHEKRRDAPQRLPVLAPRERWPIDPRAAAAFPLSSPGGGVSAILAIWNTAEVTFDPRSLRDVAAVLPYASLHLTQVQTHDAVRDDSVRDPLTGLLNRRGFEERMAEETARASRYGHPLALAMLDIDHFKAINDTYGHDGGDAVLRALGQLLTSTLRDNDYPARIGGEEFVALLVEAPLEAATETAERLRARIQAMEVPWKGDRIPVTASFGVSAVPECVSEAGALVQSADEALYASKHGGRNRVTVAARARR